MESAFSAADVHAPIRPRITRAVSSPRYQLHGGIRAWYFCGNGAFIVRRRSTQHFPLMRLNVNSVQAIRNEHDFCDLILVGLAFSPRL